MKANHPVSPLPAVNEKKCDYAADTRNGFENIDEDNSLKEELEGQQKDSKDVIDFKYIYGLEDLK